jgi:hypothetical protein
MTEASLLAMAAPSAPRPCDECRWGDCRFRVPRIRAWIIAYCEAVRHRDDPAEYIRDSIRPSRPDAPIEPLVRDGKRPDPHWHIDAKLALEAARDVGGIAINNWNAERIAAWLCGRAAEAPPVDSEGRGA